MVHSARIKVYKAIKTWRQDGKYVHPDVNKTESIYCQRHLSDLLGVEWIVYMTDEQIRTCEKLSGENGYTFYRLLLIQRGLVHE